MRPIMQASRESLEADVVGHESSMSGIRPLWHHLTPPDGYRYIELVRGDGIYVFDNDGQRYIDAMSTMGAVMVGHGRKELVSAAERQMSELSFAALTLGCTNRPARQLAQRILDLLNLPDGAVWFMNSGSEAVETALRIAIQYHANRGDTQRRIILTCTDGYHGTTLGAAAATGAPDWEMFWGNAGVDFVRLPPTPDTEDGSEAFLTALERTIEETGPERIAALIAEPIPTPGRTRVPPASHWRRVQNVLHSFGILHIADEVFMGFGRAGSMFSQQLFGVTGDLTTMAKGLTSGYVPLSACAVSGRVADEFGENGPRSLRMGGTYSGHPVGCAVGLAALDIYERENLPAHADATGKEFGEQLRDVVERHDWLTGPYGRGMIYTIIIEEPEGTQLGAAFRESCLRRGLLISPRAAAGLNLYPPLVTTADQVGEITSIIAAAAKDAEAQRVH
jgi:adenosylmethionine-8-amino-7-oxononanoate aminotransferase